MNKTLVDSKKVQLDIGIQHADGSIGGDQKCIVVNTQDCTFEYTLKDNIVEYRLSFKALTEDSIDIISKLKQFLRLEEVHYCTQQSTYVKYSFNLNWKQKENDLWSIVNQFDDCTVTDWVIQKDFVLISGEIFSKTYAKTESFNEVYFEEILFYEKS